MRLFLALCRSRTIGGAGLALAVDASTVSRRLVILEQALAAKLFDRGRNGIAPTKAAEDLLPVAEEMESVMARFGNAADRIEHEVSGLVRITCPPDVAEIVLVPLLGELYAKHPKLRLELIPGEAVLDLARRDADLALRTVRPTRGDLIVTRLTTVRWVPVAAPNMVKQLGTLRSWSDAPWLGWGERLANIPPARWLTAQLGSAEPILRSDSMRVQIAVLAAGIGVALLPEPSVKPYGLMPLKIATALREDAQSLPSDELFLVTHRALRDVPRVQVLWELLVERLGKRS